MARGSRATGGTTMATGGTTHDNGRHDDGKGRQCNRRHANGVGRHDVGDWRHNDGRHDNGKGQKEAAAAPPPAYQWQHHRVDVYKYTIVLQGSYWTIWRGGFDDHIRTILLAFIPKLIVATMEMFSSLKNSRTLCEAS